MRQRSLQQRLEQLVAVHRQLLRKYGSLELDCAELKKKIFLRDDRIRHLELTAKHVSNSVRQSVESSMLAEVASIKQSMQVRCY
jgi:kinesin family protein 5